MNISKLVTTLAIAATLVLSSVSASATTSYTFESTKVKNLIFDKEFTFTGLAAGTYNVIGNLQTSGISLAFLAFDNTLESVLFSFGGATKSTGFSLSNFVYDGVSPLTIDVYGLKSIFAKKGSFTGSLDFSLVSAVPEADTYGMMLAGLGLMGFVAYRRRTN